MKTRAKRISANVTLGLLMLISSAFGDTSDNFSALQLRLNDTLLDVYAGATIAPENAPAKSLLQLRAGLQSEAAWRLLDDAAKRFTNVNLPQQVGATRGLLQHIAALEMLQGQTAGNIAGTQSWRAVIALPKYANAVDGALLLQQSDARRVQQSSVSRVLASEYLTWQVMRVRQLCDYLQQGVANGEATDAFIGACTSEILALANFPPELLEAAGLPAATAHLPARPEMTAPFDSDASRNALAAWRDNVEATLPNLLNPADVTRLERLLVRFVKLVPREYRNGVHDRHITIMLEFREARQFTEQAQALANELAPVWRRDHAEIFAQYQQPLREGLDALSSRIHKLAAQDAVDESAKNVADLLEEKFQLSSRRDGAKADVIEETALEVRTALNDSLAAAKSDQWEQAESLRLDAYTSFDSEIEVRVLPRNPELGRRTERSFLDGGADEPGIKALLDRRAPMEELSAGYERTLQYLDQSVSLLRVAVSPATIGFTAFSILAREGLEAVIVLAALLAGLRGAENKGTRRCIGSGAWLALGASALTFWLSKTLIQSLAHYGEKLEAVVSILAVVILLMVTNWVFHKFYWVGWNAKLRSLSKASQQSASARWEWLALVGVGFLTVYREGFETTLFMQSLLLEGSTWPVAIGVILATAFIALVGLSIFKFGTKLPYRKLLVVTGVLVVSIMVTFLGSTVRLFQTVGWVPIHPIPWLNIPAWAGLWLGLYPSWEGLCIPPLALVYVGGAWLWVKLRAGSAGAPGADLTKTGNEILRTSQIVTRHESETAGPAQPIPAAVPRMTILLSKKPTQ
jgi:high-affinity iron transporter